MKVRLLISIFVWVLSFALYLVPPPSQAEPGSRIDLRLKDGLLSARIEQAPLGDVLEHLSRVLQVGISTQKEYQPRNRISVQFQSQDVREGVKRILQGESYLVLQNEEAHPAKADADITGSFKIVLYPVGTSGDCAPSETRIQSVQSLPLQDLECILLQEDVPVESRFLALEAVMSQGNGDEICHLLERLADDPHPRIRQFAQNFLNTIGSHHSWNATARP